MTVDYSGATLLDSDGEKVGTIERSYEDESGTPRFLDVRLGSIVRTHRLVPADQAEQLPEGVRVPYTKDTIEESPAGSWGDTLEGEDLTRVRGYYSQDFGRDT